MTSKIINPLLTKRNLLNPSLADKWTEMDHITRSTQASLKKVNRSEDDKKRAFAVANWTKRVYKGIYSTYLKKIEQKESVTVDEYIESCKEGLSKLDSSIEFDFSRFSSLEPELGIHNLTIVTSALGEEVLLPNGFFSANDLSSTGFVSDTPILQISHAGRLIPIFQISLTNSIFGIFGLSTHLTESKEHIATLIATSKVDKDFHATYKENGFKIHEFEDFKFDESVLGGWISVHYFRHHGENVYEAKMYDDRAEILNLSDSAAATEARLNRRITRIMYPDNVFKARLITKPNSKLLRKLETGNANDKSINSEILDGIRAKCLAMEQVKFPLYHFILPFALYIRESDKSIKSPDFAVSAELVKLFEERIKPHESIKGKDLTPREIWFKWLYKNLVGKNGTEKESISRIDKTSDLIRDVASDIINTHFHRDLSGVSPGYVDKYMTFKGWTFPPEL